MSENDQPSSILCDLHFFCPAQRAQDLSPCHAYVFWKPWPSSFRLFWIWLEYSHVAGGEYPFWWFWRTHKLWSAAISMRHISWLSGCLFVLFHWRLCLISALEDGMWPIRRFFGRIYFAFYTVDVFWSGYNVVRLAALLKKIVFEAFQMLFVFGRL